MEQRQIFKYLGYGLTFLGIFIFIVTDKNNSVAFIVLMAGLFLFGLYAVSSYKNLSADMDKKSAEAKSLKLSEELQKLKELRDEEFITSEEYETRRKELKTEFDRLKEKYIN